MNQAVITQFNDILFLLIYEENELVECHPLMEKQSLQIGNIYIGRVEKVVKNIQSAFIRLDEENVGYLPLDDKPARILNRKLPKGLPSIAENDLILVQVEQEPQKMKQARVTGNISLSGKYVVLDLQQGRIGLSKKIKDEKRGKELKELITDKWKDGNLLPLSCEEKNYQKAEGIQHYGCIFRTACDQADNRFILSEFEMLSKEVEQLLRKATYERKTGCIKEGKKEYLEIIEEYGIDRIHEIKTDIPEVSEQLREIVPTVVFYEDKEYPLFKLLRLETEINRLINKRVWLKSGGFLIIEPTEAMVVIDVNSGKSMGKKKREKHIFEINMEAAKEIIRQIRLRNLSGIIVVDFINMKEENYKNQIVQCLEQGFKKDKIPGYFVEITRLGLFELTRKKIRKPLHEILDHTYMQND